MSHYSYSYSYSLLPVFVAHLVYTVTYGLSCMTDVLGHKWDDLLIIFTLGYREWFSHHTDGLDGKCGNSSWVPLSHVKKRFHLYLAAIKSFAVNLQILLSFFAATSSFQLCRLKLCNSDFGLKTLCSYFTTAIMQIKHFATLI